jgi:hypothetical protein
MREGSMAARLLMLVVVIVLVFAALYGCAQQAAKDRQPMKRVKEPTTAQIAAHTPQESDDHLRRAKRGVVVRAGNSAVVARAGEDVVSVGDLKTAKGEGVHATAPSGEV